MAEVEKLQGIELDRLFRVIKTVDMPEGRKVRIRALSDTEMQDRSRAALAARFVAEKRLKDKESVEYQATLLPLEDADDDQLRSSLLQLRKDELQEEAVRELEYQFVPYPDDAKDEEKLEAMGKQEESIKEIDAKREIWIKNRLERYAESLMEKDSSWLRRECGKKTAAAFGKLAFREAMAFRTIFMATERLDGERYFECEEEARSLPTAIINRLYEAMAEVNSVDPLDLPGPSASA